MSVTTYSGRCGCGGVVFEVTAPTKWCANCHCSRCRRSHMAPWVTWVGVESSQFRLVAGHDLVTEYASSDTGRREFCRRCGSTLFFRGTRWPTETHIARAAFDGDIDREVSADVFYDDRATWHRPAPGGARYGGADGTTPIAD